MLKSKTDTELKDLAMAIVKNEVFTHCHLDNQSDIGMVFIPLSFGLNLPEEDLADIGMVYEYNSKASPRSVNGYPMFTSLNLLNKEDFKKVNEKINEINQALSSIK